MAKELKDKPFHLIASHCQSWGLGTALDSLRKVGWVEKEASNVTVMSRTTYQVPVKYAPYYVIFNADGLLIHHNMGGPFHGGDGTEKYRELVRAAVREAK